MLEAQVLGKMTQSSLGPNPWTSYTKTAPGCCVQDRYEAMSDERRVKVSSRKSKFKEVLDGSLGTHGPGSVQIHFIYFQFSFSISIWHLAFGICIQQFSSITKLSVRGESFWREEIIKFILCLFFSVVVNLEGTSVTYTRSSSVVNLVVNLGGTNVTYLHTYPTCVYL